MRNDDAVSPVIAVILLVAITVVLAAVVFFVVTDASSNSGKPPISNLQPVAGTAPTGGLDGNLIGLTHSGGDCLQLPDLRFALRTDAGLVALTYTDADGKVCVGETLILEEASAFDFDAADEGGRYQLVVIDQITNLIVFEELVTLGS